MSEYNPLDIHEQEEEQRDKAVKSKLAQETEEADFKWLMSSKRGRRIIWRLLDQSGVFRSSFNPTAMVMAFNEGNRNYGNRTLAMVHQHCPELYPQMMKENTNGRSSGNASHNDQ